MLKLYGHSDDCAEAEGLRMARSGGSPGVGQVLSGQRDEFGCCDAGMCFVVGGLEGGVSVTLQYRNSGCWGAVCEPIDEDVPIPWAVTIDAQRYTVVVCIAAPDGTPVKAERVEAQP